MNNANKVRWLRKKHGDHQGCNAAPGLGDLLRQMQRKASKGKGRAAGIYEKNIYTGGKMRSAFHSFKEYGNMAPPSIIDNIAAISQKSIIVYGGERQQRKLSEECGKMIAAINQYQEGQISPTHLASEVAGVEICCHHLREMLTHEVVDVQKEIKLKRLADNLGMDI